VRIAFIVAVVLATGCKDKTGPAVTPGSGSSTAAAADAAGSAQPDERPALTLPKLSGKPPVATKTKHTKAEYEKLGKQLEFVDWERDVRRALDNVLEVKHTTKIRPKISVRVLMSACLKCVPMDVEKWRAQKEALRMELPEELRDKPGTVFEIGEATLGGAKVISVYGLGTSFGKDDNGPTGAYMNALTLHFNDGINQIKLVTSYADDPIGTKEDLVKVVPREHLEKIGLAFLDQYLQAWGN
jgi:hypothetical protein